MYIPAGINVHRSLPPRTFEGLFYLSTSRELTECLPGDTSFTNSRSLFVTTPRGKPRLIVHSVKICVAVCLFKRVWGNVK